MATQSEFLEILIHQKYAENFSEIVASGKYASAKKLISRKLVRVICRDLGVKWFNIIAYLRVKNSLLDRFFLDLESENIIAFGDNPKTGRRERISAEHWAFVRRNRAFIRQPHNGIILTSPLQDADSVMFFEIELLPAQADAEPTFDQEIVPTDGRKRRGRKIRDEWVKVAAIACRRVHDGGLPKSRTKLVEDILSIQDASHLDEPYKEERITALVDAIFDEFQRKTDLYDEKAPL